MESWQYVVSVLSTNAPWLLNFDLCTSNPLIMFILSPNPSVPCSFSVCPGICCQWPPSSSWSGLRPALAACPRPRHVRAACLPPGWATSEVTVATLALDTLPIDLNPFVPVTLTLPNSDLSSSSMDLNIWGSSRRWMGPRPLPTLSPSCGGPTKKGLVDLELPKVHVEPRIVRSFLDQQTTSNPIPTQTPAISRQWVYPSFDLVTTVKKLLTVQLQVEVLYKEKK